MSAGCVDGVINWCVCSLIYDFFIQGRSARYMTMRLETKMPLRLIELFEVVLPALTGLVSCLPTGRMTAKYLDTEYSIYVNNSALSLAVLNTPFLQKKIYDRNYEQGNER